MISPAICRVVQTCMYTTERTECITKKHSCRRETALQGGLVMAKSGRLKLIETIFTDIISVR